MGKPKIDEKFEQIDEQLADIAINVKTMGAIGDGASHPLSEKYNTLAQAQLAFPNVGITALTQELNWAVLMQAFYIGGTTKRTIKIPSGTYFVKDSLTFGVATTQSVELGNFIIEGDGVKSTKLIFDIQDVSTPAFNLASNVNSLTVKDLFLKNSTQRKGIGVYIPAYGMQIKFQSVTVFNFYVGFDLKVIVSNFDTCVASACCCGFRIRFTTSTTFNNCYGQLSVKDGADTASFAGVNWYIEECVYTKLIACASDGAASYGTLYGYKFESSSENVVCTLDSCGCEGCNSAIYINSPTAVIKIINISTYNNNLIGIFAHVESGKYIEFDGGRVLNSPYKITKGANIGNGVIRTLHNHPISNGNTAYYNPTLSTDRSIYAINDCTFDVIPRSANSVPINEGRGVFIGATLDLKLMTNSNGYYACADITIIPLRQEENSSDIEARAGRVTLVVNNSSSYIRKHIWKDNANVVVTATSITNGFQFVVNPLNGVPYGGSCLFIVNTYANENTDHNQKTVGTYTGRKAIQFLGNDY